MPSWRAAARPNGRCHRAFSECRQCCRDPPAAKSQRGELEQRPGTPDGAHSRHNPVTPSLPAVKGLAETPTPAWGPSEPARARIFPKADQSQTFPNFSRHQVVVPAPGPVAVPGERTEGRCHTLSLIVPEGMGDWDSASCLWDTSKVALPPLRRRAGNAEPLPTGIGQDHPQRRKCAGASIQRCCCCPAASSAVPEPKHRWETGKRLLSLGTVVLGTCWLPRGPVGGPHLSASAAGSCRPWPCRAVPDRALLTHLDRLSFPAAKWLCTVCQRPRAAFPAPGSLWADTLLLIPSSPSRCLSPGRPSRSPDSPAAADAVSLAPDNREPLGRAGGRTPPDRHERSRTDIRMDVENVGSRQGMRGGRQSRRGQTDKRRTDR